MSSACLCEIIRRRFCNSKDNPKGMSKTSVLTHTSLLRELFSALRFPSSITGASDSDTVHRASMRWNGRGAFRPGPHCTADGPRLEPTSLLELWAKQLVLGAAPTKNSCCKESTSTRSSSREVRIRVPGFLNSNFEFSPRMR